MSIHKASTLFLATLTALTLVACSNSSTTGGDADVAKPLRWGSDDSGGAPYEFRDPKEPSKRIGFEVEIADELAKRLNRKIEFVQTPWENLIPALNRGDFDFAMSGIEITPERQAECAFTEPYYIYTQQLVVGASDTNINSLDDLKGHSVGTLGASAAERLLKTLPGIEIKSYDDNVRPYDDLEIGRVKGVLLDLPIAEHYARPRKNLRFAGEPFAPGLYAMAVRKQDSELRQDLDAAINDMKQDGTLETILARWNLWNDAQTTVSQ